MEGCRQSHATLTMTLIWHMFECFHDSSLLLFASLGFRVLPVGSYLLDQFSVQHYHSLILLILNLLRLISKSIYLFIYLFIFWFLVFKFVITFFFSLFFLLICDTQVFWIGNRSHRLSTSIYNNNNNNNPAVTTF